MRYLYSLLCVLGLVCCVSCANNVSNVVTQNEPGPDDPDMPQDFLKTESGLRYRIRRVGDGAKPHANNAVTVHYRGWLDDGTIFDSSYKRGEPATFGLRGVISGWTEGLQLVAEGGKIELDIPSDLGYGPNGMGDSIPGGARLHFIVELQEIH